MKKIILPIIVFVALSLILSPKVSADVLFEDNFGSYADNSFPTKWTEYIQFPKCSASWVVKNGELGIQILQNGCNAHILPNNVEWPNSLSEYIIEFDARFVSGIDRHINYRINPLTSFIHVLHFQSPGDFTVDFDNPTYHTIVNKNYAYGISHHFKIWVMDGRLKVYYGQNATSMELVRDVSQSSIPSGTFGFGSNPGSGVPTETWFDNVRVTTLDHQDSLEVPVFKQTENPWGPTLYDSANLWAGNNNDMSRWGCAVTSAAMVFKYHGIEKMPDNSDLDPGTLNAWLKSQPDGYVLNGYVNWLALSRLSLLSKPNNSYDGFDALEYNRISGENKTQLIDDITNKIPGILEEPGHFIVAKGEDVANSSFLINDPYYSRDSLLDYGNTFLSLGRFIPSQTDLSYIMFVVDKDINISLKDSNGNEVGESYIQEPISNPLGESEGGSAIKMLYLQKPADGNYFLDVSSPSTTNYHLDGYLYDKNGKVKKIDLNGVVGVGDIDTYQIKQNKENINQGGIKQVVTFDSLKRDIALFYKAGKIRNFGKYAAWTAQVDQAKFISKISKKGAKVILQVLKKQITSEKKAIDFVSKGILLNEITILISTL